MSEGHLADGAGEDASDVRVVLVTPLGEMELAVYSGRAPKSAAAFLELIDDGSFTRYGAFYRTVRSNENDHGQPCIDVVQAALRGAPSMGAPIPHESTLDSGLLHLDGTIALPRREIGTATGGGFFVCVGDQPHLDAGGTRNPDGQGFAAFGRVKRGMDIVRRIHQLPTSTVAADRYLNGQILDPPVRILRAGRAK